MTLINVYAPPDSDKHFFKSLFDVIALETEGVCIYGRDFNVILKQTIDTTSLKNNKNKLTKLITAWEDMFFFDVWRYAHPLERNYTHYSAPHLTYSRSTLGVCMKK